MRSQRFTHDKSYYPVPQTSFVVLCSFGLNCPLIFLTCVNRVDNGIVNWVDNGINLSTKITELVSCRIRRFLVFERKTILMGASCSWDTVSKNLLI